MCMSSDHMICTVYTWVRLFMVKTKDLYKSYNKNETMIPQLAVVCKWPRLKNVYKSNGRCQVTKFNNNGNKWKEQQEVLGLHHKRTWL